ncbi:4Fe-4S binding protein [Planotetraspora thailandica]
MPYVITGGCCADASCIDVCPVDCIHPTPSERGFLDADMLFIDPDSCIECGACRPACPVDAIRPDHELSPGLLPYISLARAHFSGDRTADAGVGPVAADLPSTVKPGLRVAVVGAGAAGGYAARELLKIPGVQIDVYERNLTPYGLVRFGIAPDHPQTKLVEAVFPFTTGNPNLRLHLGVEVGRHITHAELVSFHHAVVTRPAPTERTGCRSRAGTSPSAQASSWPGTTVIRASPIARSSSPTSGSSSSATATWHWTWPGSSPAMSTGSPGPTSPIKPWRR